MKAISSPIHNRVFIFCGLHFLIIQRKKECDVEKEKKKKERKKERKKKKKKEGRLSVIVANLVDNDILVSEFELHLRY